MPPPVGRDLLGYLGQGVEQLDDTLEITSWSTEQVSGVATGVRMVDGQVEDYRFGFRAENCGMIDGGVVVGR